MEKFYRHGDVFLKRIASLPNGLKKDTSNVLAYGEITGHKHQLSKSGQVLINPQGQKFVKIEQEATLTHEEHKQIVLEAGTYEVVIEREYEPFKKEIRKVMD